MKIAFSTLGCPEWTWEDIYTMAKDIGFNGIELRGLGHEIHSYNVKPFQKEEIQKTRDLLKSLHLDIACISSSCCIKDKQSVENTIQEGFRSIDLAKKIDCEYVRILGDQEPYETTPVNESDLMEALLELSDYALKNEVTLLIETNGVYADSNKLKKLMQRCARTNIGILWDVHHPIRYKNERPTETYSNLKQWIRYIHVKDSVIENGSVHYKMIGEGNLQIAEILELLKNDQYDGYVSLEWVKRWSREIEDAAIVFPHFVHFMKKYTTPVIIIQPPVESIRLHKPYEKDILINITLSALASKMAREYPEQEAFVFPQFNERYTYKEFNQKANLIARAFSAIGIHKNDHVAMWATNYPQWVLTLFACAKIGAVLVTVNTSYKNHEIEYILRQSDSSALVMIDGYKDSDYISIIQSICPELAECEPGALNSERLPLLKSVISISTLIKGAFHWNDLEQIARSVSEEEITKIENTHHENEVINIQYTSGTTGFPKGVMLTHYNIINNGKTIGDCMDFTNSDRLLVCVPLFHCFGLVLALMASYTHASTMVVMEYFQSLPVIKALQQEKCTAMHGVPTMFIACLEHPEFNQYDFSAMRTGIMAGSPCPVKVMNEVVEKMNMSEITIVYGQTEASPGCTQTRTFDSLEKRVSTVGKALPGVECKIIDPETGKDLPAGKQGEFIARGYNVMRGYYKMPEATANAINEDGWLHTGDLAVMDNEGYYKITGRIKDMIIRGGENIYPKEIEEFLYTHPQIKDVQVVGVPDAIYGEEILAAIILKKGAQLTESEIKKYVKNNIAKHKTPKYIKFIDQFPMTASGKIQKYKIREDAIEEFQLSETSPEKIT